MEYHATIEKNQEAIHVLVCEYLQAVFLSEKEVKYRAFVFYVSFVKKVVVGIIFCFVFLLLLVNTQRNLCRKLLLGVKDKYAEK